MRRLVTLACLVPLAFALSGCPELGCGEGRHSEFSHYNYMPTYGANGQMTGMQPTPQYRCVDNA